MKHKKKSKKTKLLKEVAAHIKKDAKEDIKLVKDVKKMSKKKGC